MKRYFSALTIALGIALTSTAQNKEKIEKIAENQVSYKNNLTKNISQIPNKSKFIFDGNYTIDFNRKENISTNKESGLEILLADARNFCTTFNVFDKDFNGVSNGDYFKLTHDFQNGEILEISAKFGEDYRVLINSEIKKDGKVISRYEKDTSDYLILEPLFVTPKVKKAVAKGDEGYIKFIEDIVSGKNPALPYNEVMFALNTCEIYLTTRRKDKAKIIVYTIKNSLRKSLAEKYDFKDEKE